MLEISKKAQITGHKGSIYTLQSVDEDHVLSGGGEGWLVQWDLKNPDPGKLLARVESNVFAAQPASETIIAGDMNGGIHWIDLKSNLSTDLQHHKRGIYAIFKHEDWIYALGGDGYISRRPKAFPRKVESVQICLQALRCYAHYSNEKIAIGSSDGCIYHFDLNQMKIIKVIENAHSQSVFCLYYDSKRNRFWSGGRDAQIKVWDYQGQIVKSIPGHMYTVNSLVANDDETLIFSGSRDKSIKVWDADNFELLKVIDGIRDGGHLNSVNCLLWCPNYQYLISGSDDKSIGIWRIVNQ